LGIRVAAGETSEQHLFDWWTEYQEKTPVERVAFASDLKPERKRKRRPQRRNRNFYRKRSQNGDHSGNASLPQNDS
jgi:poly(A) polymerase